MFTLTFSVYQAQTIWLMLIYNKMKAWFGEAYKNIGGEWVNVVCFRQIQSEQKTMWMKRVPKIQMPMEWA